MQLLYCQGDGLVAGVWHNLHSLYMYIIMYGGYLSLPTVIVIPYTCARDLSDRSVCLLLSPTTCTC